MQQKLMCPSCNNTLELTEEEINLDESEFLKECTQCNKKLRVDIDWEKIYTPVVIQ